MCPLYNLLDLIRKKRSKQSGARISLLERPSLFNRFFFLKEPERITTYMIFELQKENFYQATSIFKDIPVSQSLIQNSLNQEKKGRVWVDDLDKCKAALVIHPSGEACIGGIPYTFSVSDLREKVATEKSLQTIIAPTEQWKNCLNEILGNLFEVHNEIGFSLTPSQWVDSFTPNLPDRFLLKRIDPCLCRKIQKTWPGTNWFWGWDSAEAFAANGRGYAIVHKNEVVSFVSTTFPYGSFSKYLEFNIQTSPLYRQRGFATILCATLLRYCFRNGFTASWSTEVENLSSQNLAQKLGFKNPRLSYWFEKK